MMTQGIDSPCLYGDFSLFRGCFDGTVDMFDFFNHRDDIDGNNYVPELDLKYFLKPMDFFVD